MISRLVGLHSVFQELNLISLLKGLLFQPLIVMSQGGNFLAEGVNLCLIFFNLVILIVIVLD